MNEQMGVPGGGPIVNPRPDWSLATNMVCEECQNDTFIQAVNLQRLSKIVAVTDKDMVRPVPVFACSKCGHVNKEFRVPKA